MRFSRCAALALAFLLAAPASAQIAATGAGEGGFGGSATFAPLSPAPGASALFHTDNATYVPSTSNNGLQTNGGLGHGAFYAPATVTNSWFMLIAGAVDSTFISNSTASSQSLGSGSSSINYGCGTVSCTGGYERSWTIGSLFVDGYGLFGNAKRLNYPFWNSGQVVAISGGSLTSAQINEGFWSWTATGTGCAVAPRGMVGGAAGQRNTSVTYPGQGCPTSGTFVVTTDMAPGASPTSGLTVVTLTFGPGTGVQMPPGKRFCGVIGQWGTDSTLSGQQFAAFIDDKGVPLTGSPSVSTTVNNSPTAAGFYYSAANTLVSQSTLSDILTLFGSTETGTTAHYQGWGGQLGPVGMMWGVFPSVSGAPSASALAALCAGDPVAWAASNSVTVHSLYRLNDTVYGDSSHATFSGTISGTGLTTTGNPAIQIGDTIAGAGVTGCPAACPKIASGSGNAWVLTTSGGTVGPIPLTAGLYAPMLPLSSTVAPMALGGSAVATDALTLAKVDPYAVSAIRPGQSYGSIVVAGTYNAATLGGTPTAIQAKVSATPNGTALSGCQASCDWQTVASPGGGKFYGSLAGVPPGGPYYLSIRAANGPAYVVTGNPFRVGAVMPVFGQSQQQLMFSASNAGYQLAVNPNAQGTILASGLGTVGTYYHYWSMYQPLLLGNGVPAGNANTKIATPASTTGASNTLFGDGDVALYNGFAALTGWPVEHVMATRSGNASYLWSQDQLPLTQTLGTGDGATTTFSGALIVAGAQYPFSGSADSSGINTILAGSLSISVGGVKICDDSAFGPVPAMTVYSGTCAGAGVSASTLRYDTSNVSVTFATPPAAGAAVVASWTNVSDDMVTSTNNTRTATTQYVPQSTFGDGTHPESGWMSGLLPKLPGGPSVVDFEQCTSDASSLAAFGSTGAGGAGQQARWSTVFAATMPRIFNSTWAQAKGVAPWPSDVTVMATGYPRSDQGFPYTNEVACQAWIMAFGRHSALSGYIAGNTLTLTADATGFIWIGEWLSGAGGAQIQGFTGGTFGKAGSTYTVSVSQTTGSSGAPATFGNLFEYKGSTPPVYGGAMTDASLAASYGFSSAGAGPHSGAGYMGVARIMRRKTAHLAATMLGSHLADEPTIVSAAFDLTSTYNAACAATPHSCILVTVRMDNPNGNALATCGTDPAGGAHIIGSISAGTLTVSNLASGTLATGQALYGTGIATSSGNNPGLSITAGSGTSWTVSDSSITIPANTAMVSGIHGQTPGNYAPVPTGSCAFATAAGTNVEGFMIGPSPTVFYANDGLNPVLNTFNNGGTEDDTFLCSLADATHVLCRKNAGAWGSSTYLSYLRDDVFARNGVLMGPRRAGGYLIDNPGACTTGTPGSPATTTLALSGASGTHGTIKFTWDSTNGITSAVPVAGGYLTSGTTEVVNYPTTYCSGAHIQGAYPANQLVVDALTGGLLYDNSGRAGQPLNALLYTAGASPNTTACNLASGVAGFCEPGMPVTPAGVEYPWPVTGY